MLLITLVVSATACNLSFSRFQAPEPDATPLEPENLNFLVVGDWGRNGWFRQDKVARTMGKVAAVMHADFVITTGDNFYPKGVESVKDGQWVRSYEAIYTAPSLHVPWYPVLGNHDYEGDAFAQIRYSQQSDRWRLPARYYALEHRVDDRTDALFIFLDTVPLVDGTLPETPDVSDEPEVLRWDADEQLRWLDSTLAASDAEWRFVVGHHPVYSADGKHTDAPILRERLSPILHRHGVDAYLAGHVHSLQHLDPAETDVAHFVSGGGSLAREVADDPAVVFAEGVSGFMAVSLRPEEARVRFIDHEGTVGYETTLTAGTAERGHMGAGTSCSSGRSDEAGPR